MSTQESIRNPQSAIRNSTVRVRMAPSPTGMFHVGSARTALFNFLFARHHGGAFVLRVEDTDAQRNDPEFEKVIYQAMDWLGLKADEGPQTGGEFGPYRQSERFDIYREYSNRLLESGAAYKAYETPEELAAMKEEQAKQKQPPRYNGAHRDLTKEQRAAFEAEGRKAVIRFRVPEGETGWTDLVRGDVKWQNKEIDDFVIGKSDGSPTYNFACVIDDALMKISHVIRGEDGLSNTPRQIMIYNALGLQVPQFAHLPFLLGRDRSKLSKRHGPVSLLDYRDNGILPDAMFNYLAMLGWNPGGGETQEIFSRDELIEKFSLEGVNKSGAIFDIEKLLWMNTQYLRAMSLEQFIETIRPHLGDIEFENNEYSRRAFELVRERVNGYIEKISDPENPNVVEEKMRALGDVYHATKFFFSDEYSKDEAGAAKHLTEVSRPRLQKLHDKLAAVGEWNHDNIEAALRELATELSIKPAELIHPSRMAVSGRTVGPSIFELLEALGRERVLARLQKASSQ